MNAAEKILIHPDADIRPLVAGYLDGVRGNLDSAGLSLDAGQLEDVRFIGHNLKGTGASFGCDDLTRLGGLMEEAAKAGNAAEARARLRDLTAYLTRVELAPS